MVDTGSQFTAAAVHAQIRHWRGDPLHTVVFSHGHIDHVFGVGTIDAEADRHRRPRPTVVAHEGVPARFDRYVRTAGYNAIVNQRQFQAPGLEWPVDYRYPDRTYHDTLRLTVGQEAFELRHAGGETDDHTWTWVPAQRILCCGDLFIWASPNAGNPQKAQRYPAEFHGVRAEVFAARRAAASSVMARGICAWAESESRRVAGPGRRRH